MKLLIKTTLYFITVSLLTFFVGGLIFYHAIHKSLEKNIDIELQNRMHHLISDMKSRQINPEDAKFITGGTLDIHHASESEKTTVQFGDTILYNKYYQKHEPFRYFRFYVKVDEQIFRIHLYKSLNEASTFIEKFALGLTALVLVFLLSILILNRLFFRKIWANFLDTTDKIKNYDLNSKQELNFKTSDIIEFQQLNSVLEKMIKRIRQDYDSLNEFTENLTHEIQTPIAIVKTKIELLMQNPNLTEADLELVHIIYNQIVSLSKLNKSLTLITKIEHNQFVNTESINIEERVKFHLNNFEEILEMKQIACLTDFGPTDKPKMDKTLADILIINLLKNAAKHNIPHGYLKITTRNQQLTIANSGKDLSQNQTDVFDRYKTESKSESSMGLGLTIVKKICDLYGFEIDYACLKGEHRISVNFKV